MQIIAILIYGNDWPVAFVQIPEGLTEAEAFVKWFRGQNKDKEISDKEILELPYEWQTCTVEKLDDGLDAAIFRFQRHIALLSSEVAEANQRGEMTSHRQIQIETLQWAVEEILDIKANQGNKK